MKSNSIFNKQLLYKIKILLMVCAAYYLVTWFTGCPVRYFLGISCPGCGMTRAWLCLLRLDFSGAFYCHPLFWTAPLIVCGFLFDDRIPPKLFRLMAIVTAVLFILVYLVRLIWFPGEITVWEPESGVIWQTIERLFFWLPRKSNFHPLPR